MSQDEFMLDEDFGGFVDVTQFVDVDESECVDGDYYFDDSEAAFDEKLNELIEFVFD